MSQMRSPARSMAMLVGLLSLTVPHAVQSATTAAPSVPHACTDPIKAGSLITEAAHYHSVNGNLAVSLSYYTFVDSDGLTNFCLLSQNGDRSPTLHVQPGDTLTVEVMNMVPASSDNTVETGTNLHFHGLAVSPLLPQDDQVNVNIPSGGSFTYQLMIPMNHYPGLFWYHPHIFPITESALLGGASGAIVVEGIEDLKPVVSGVDSFILQLRGNVAGDSEVSHAPDPADVPAWDISANYVPINYPNYTTPYINVLPSQDLFLRIVNSNVGVIFDLNFFYDNVLQEFEIIARDGVPIESRTTASSYLLAPAYRLELLIKAPPAGTKVARLITNAYNTGPDGDFDPARPILEFRLSTSGLDPFNKMPVAQITPMNIDDVVSFEIASALRSLMPAKSRKLILYEEPVDQYDPNSDTVFYINEEGMPRLAFGDQVGPSITTMQGTVEDWTIENQTGESHVFHIHQVHFVQVAENGVSTQFTKVLSLQDSILVPFFDEPSMGQGNFPSVTLRMNFVDIDAGIFMYHCHILEHEDKGMMALIQVLNGTADGDGGDMEPAVVWGDGAGYFVAIMVLVVLGLLVSGIMLIRKDIQKNKKGKRASSSSV